MKFALAAAAALFATTAMPAAAAQITYTFGGTFTGNIAGNPFTTDAVFTGNGNTANANNNGFGFSGILAVPLATFAAVAGGQTYNITTPGFFYLYNPPAYGAQNTRLGFGFGTGGNNAVGLESAAFNGYDGLSSFALTAAPVYFQSASFNTDQGFVNITGVTNGSFGALAVPEPAAWGLMIVGFGAIGGALRRRNARVTTTVRYA